MTVMGKVELIVPHCDFFQQFSKQQAKWSTARFNWDEFPWLCVRTHVNFLFLTSIQSSEL